MMGWHGTVMSPVQWLAMGLSWLLLLTLIVWLVAKLLPGSAGETTRATRESALETLDHRMAAGEIELAAWQAQRAALVASQANQK